MGGGGGFEPLKDFALTIFGCGRRSPGGMNRTLIPGSISVGGLPTLTALRERLKVRSGEWPVAGRLRSGDTAEQPKVRSNRCRIDMFDVNRRGRIVQFFDLVQQIEQIVRGPTNAGTVAGVQQHRSGVHLVGGFGTRARWSPLRSSLTASLAPSIWRVPRPKKLTFRTSRGRYNRI